MKNPLNQYMDIRPDVQEALKNNAPLVALESTIISHGMPYPQNVEMARKVESIIRQGGAIPATMAIINGRLKIGLTDDEIEYLAQSKDVVKASRRDLPSIIAMKKDGATTVASTMILADLAGIKVFVTGGIGGVHRGAETTMDISADLEELAQTNVAVVCAGAKSILDIGLTLEYLETKGVPIIGMETDDFPAFYTQTSGYPVDYRADSASDVANTMAAKWDIGLKGGIVLANPIPKAYALDEKLISEAIENALQEAKEQGISGKATTPFLLSKVKEKTSGKSLEANLELVYNNARVGAAVAVEYSKK